jgi:hypothetical protein
MRDMTHGATLGPDGGVGGPAGSTYCGIFTLAPQEAVLGALSDLRFSGYVGPQEGPWVVAVCLRVRGAVAGDKMTSADVARALSAASGGAAFNLIVLDDKMLNIEAYRSGELVMSYYSDPTVEYPHNDELMPEPIGAQDAPAFAAALGAPELAEGLEELLGEELGESENESERVTRVLRLIGAPAWIVAAETLPKAVPSGPAAKEFTRLGAGKEGVSGRLDDAVRGIVRKKK